MVFKKGNPAHNKIALRIAREEFVARYAADRSTVRKVASEENVTIYTVYRRMREWGIDRRSGGEATRGTQAGKANPNWKGGRVVDSGGYVNVRTGTNTVRREHRVVAEAMLGRPLTEKEVVHHKNGDRQDNRPENLEVLPSQSVHMRQHMATEEARRRGRLGHIARYGLAALAVVETSDG